MIIPIRCFTCGKPVANLWDQYCKMVEQGIEPHQALETLHIRRYCCRRMFLAHVDQIDMLLKF
jgi:DNA-directed RNA polymerase subunit N (RpoN/RPB10)